LIKIFINFSAIGLLAGWLVSFLKRDFAR